LSNKNRLPEDPEPNEEASKAGFLDWVGMFFGYIWFMRRLLFGVILIAVLGYGIYRVSTRPLRNFDEGPRLVANEADPGDSLPTSDNDLAPNASGDGSKETVKPSVRRFKDLKVLEREKFAPYEPLLETGTVTELIEEILVLRGSWVGKREPVIFLSNQRRARLAGRLMELEISDDQEIFALSEYIESIIVLDMVVCQERMEAPEVRESLQEIVVNYLSHDHPMICAKANLAKLLIPLHDYGGDPQVRFLEEFSTRLEQCADLVFEDTIATRRLCSVALWLRRVCDWDGTGLPSCVKLIDRMDEAENSIVREIAVTLREQVFFQHLEPGHLVPRLDQEDKQVNGDIKEFFEGIEANPDVQIEYFQVAVSLIEKFKSIEKKAEYDSLLAWLGRISKKVRLEEKRLEIESAIRKLESLPWGPRESAAVQDPLDLPVSVKEPYEQSSVEAIEEPSVSE